MNSNQQTIFNVIASATGIDANAPRVTVTQSPTYLREPIQIADYAAGMNAAFAVNIAALGEARGLPSQSVTVDRRLATLSLNDAMFHYMNGVAITGGEITVAVNGLYESRDGTFLCFNGAYPHLRDGILNYFDAANNQPALAAAIRQKDPETIQADFAERGLCVAPMMSHDEWLAHPQGKMVAERPVIDIRRHGNAKARVLADTNGRPLDGVRVIDMTHVVAGPWITRQLAEHGADVISIRNSTLPFLYPVVLEQSYGKKQIFLDVKSQVGMARLTALLADADILVWSYTPEALDRLGLTIDVLRALNPNLVHVRESCYGLEGPWAHRKGWEQLAQTCCGAAVLASQGRDEKHIVAALPSDYGAGYLGAADAVSALRQRQAEGGFWTVDISLCGTIMLPLSLPHEAEEAVPVTAGELGEHMVD